MAERKSLMERIGTLEPTPPWGLGTVALTLIVAFIAVIIGTAVALVWLEGQPFATLVGWIVGGVITTLFVLQTRRRPDERAALRLGVGGASLLFVMFICIGFALLFDLIGLAVTGVSLPVPELLGVDLRTGGLVAWVCVIMLMIFAQPLAEELVFRGVAFPALRSVMGAWLGLVAVAAVCAVFHLLAYPPDYVNVTGITPIWYGLALPFLDGLIISAVRAHTGSTRAAVAAHVAFGLFAVVKLLGA